MSKLTRSAVVVVHLLLAVLVVATVPGLATCSGDFIGSCTTFLIPVVLLIAVGLLVALTRWFGGRPVALSVMDAIVLLMGLLASAWLVAAGAGVGLLTLVIAVAGET